MFEKSQETIQGLYRPTITQDMLASREADLARKIAAFTEGDMSWEALMGTFLELIDESVQVGAEFAATGRLQHYAVGYIHGLTDRDGFLPMEGV